MKILLLILSFPVLAVTFSAERKSLRNGQEYAVISDVYSADVPAGQCIVTGNVINPMFVEDGQPHPVQNCLISTLDRRRSTYSDTLGNYRLVLREGDTSIFLFSAGHEEIVIWNYPFKSQHVVTINFFPGYSNLIEVDKPVIYLYAGQETDAEIRFSCRGDLVFTYPHYEEKWEVMVSQEGIRENRSGKQYPYLFWEATTDDLTYLGSGELLPGFVIRADTVIPFLENCLTRLGLNPTEQTDFITFWGPQISAHPYALIQFLVDDAYTEKVAQLSVSPQPDAIRRIFLLFTPLGSPVTGRQIVPQDLPSFERKGFTVVEWGGSRISDLPLIP